MGRLGAVLLALILGSAVTAPCGDGATGPPAHDDGRRTLRRLVPNLGRGAVGVFHRDNLGPFFVGAMATGFAGMYDDEVADYIADPEHSFGKSFEDGASPELVGAVVGGVFVAGRLVESPRFRAFSYDLLDAFVVNWGYTQLLKVAVGRERPNGENDKSFPSGHTTNAFALATVAECHYGWKAGVPAYAVASLVAVSRLQRNKHYLSDVVAGAAVGYLVGRAVVRVNDAPLETSTGTTVSVVPLLGPRTRGLMAVVTF